MNKNERQSAGINPKAGKINNDSKANSKNISGPVSKAPANKKTGTVKK